MARTIVSTSQLCLSHQQQEFLAKYRTASAKQAYLDSYGEGETDFLDSRSYSDNFVSSPVVSSPYDYSVEYIEMNGSDGKCYIDLGILLENNYYDIEADFELLGYDESLFNIWFGFFSSSVFSLEVNRVSNNSAISQIVMGRWNGNSMNSFATLVGSRYDIKLYHDGVASVNGNTFPIVIDSSLRDNTSNNFLIFYGAINNCYTYGRIRSLRIYKENNLIHDFIPVVKDSEPCMYDTVSGIFSSKVGPGSLIAGPLL